MRASTYYDPTCINMPSWRSREKSLTSQSTWINSLECWSTNTELWSNILSSSKQKIFYLIFNLNDALKYSLPDYWLLASKMRATIKPLFLFESSLIFTIFICALNLVLNMHKLYPHIKFSTWFYRASWSNKVRDTFHLVVESENT